jgi:hypothetical protein
MAVEAQRAKISLFSQPKTGIIFPQEPASTVVNLYCYDDSPCRSDIEGRDATVYSSWITPWSLIITPPSYSTTHHSGASKDLADY